MSDVYPCVDVSSPSPDPVPHLLLWSERSGGALNDGRTNCLHPWINHFQGKKKKRRRKGYCLGLKKKKKKKGLAVLMCAINLDKDFVGIRKHFVL